MAKTKEQAKHQQWRCYVADCLWAQATDMRFMKEDKPTMQRWEEIAHKRQEDSCEAIEKMGFDETLDYIFDERRG